jgi:large subunit ribosomal protein L31
MKKDIHPKVNEIAASCVCGAEFKTFSTKDSVRVDICSACHPFFTGNARLMDTEGRVERFKKRYAKKS